jgi:hypothetical protein
MSDIEFRVKKSNSLIIFYPRGQFNSLSKIDLYKLSVPFRETPVFLCPCPPQHGFGVLRDAGSPGGRAVSGGKQAEI